MTLSRNLARPLMSSVFFIGPINALRNSSKLAKKAEPMTGPMVRAAQRLGLPISHDPELIVKINAGLQIAGATALATGRCPRAAAGLLAVSLVPTTLAGHRFWEETDPAVRTQQRLQFAKNLSIIGGLVITALDTDGRPGRAWLARQAAKRMSRRADHLAAMARLEAKVAALEAAGAGDTLTETLTTAGKAARVRARGLGERGRAAGGDVLAKSQDLGTHAADAASEWRKQSRDRAKELRKEARSTAKSLRKEVRSASRDARKELAKQARRARKNADAWKAKVA